MQTLTFAFVAVYFAELLKNLLKDIQSIHHVVIVADLELVCI